MTRILAANIGSYPRIGEHKDHQRFKRGLTHFEKKDISAHAFRDVLQSMVLEIVREQIDAGLDEVTDGLVSWSDPISRFCEKMSGIKITGLDRYFNTNFYYRVPVICAKPKKTGSLMADDFLFAKSVSTRPVRVVFTGPLTLAAHTASEIKPFEKLENRFRLFTDMIAEEVAQLVLKGADIIQIDEPSLATHTEAVPLLMRSFETFSKCAGPARLVGAFYFAPLATHLQKLLSLPVHELNLDFTCDGNKLMEKLLSLKKKINVGFGVLSSHTTRMEPIDPIIKGIKSWIDRVKPETCTLTPSSGLEFLPRDSAQAKILHLVKIKEALRQAFSGKKSHG